MSEFKDILIKEKLYTIIDCEYFCIDNVSPVFFTGDSGSGKTVFLRFLSGYIDFFDELKVSCEITDNQNSIFNWIEYCEQKKDNFYLGQDIDNFITGLYVIDEINSSVLNLPESEKIIMENTSFNPYSKISELSHGQKKLVLLLKALYSKAENIFLDEPFTYLDRFEREKIGRIIDSMVEHGKKVIVAGHGMELFHIEFKKLYEIADKKVKPIDKKIIRKRFFDLKNSLRKDKNKIQDEEHTLVVKDLSFSYKNNIVFENKDFDFLKSSINGICGKNGCGKTTLAKILSNKLKLKKQNNSFLEYNRKTVFIGNNPDMYFLTDSCEDEIAFFSEDIKDRLVKNVGFDIKGRRISELSYGQKIRFLIYIYCSLNKDLFILDEIFAGQDMGNIFKITVFLRKMADDEKTVMIISQDVFIVRMLADKIIKI